MLARPERRPQPGQLAQTATFRRGQPRRSSSWTSAGLAVILLFLATLGGLSGCTRAFFRERADRDVDRLLFDKATDDRWRLINYYIYPHPYARFADLTNKIDKPPM